MAILVAAVMMRMISWALAGELNFDEPDACATIQARFEMKAPCRQCQKGKDAIERSFLCAEQSPKLKSMPVVRSSNGILDVSITVEATTLTFPELGIQAGVRLYNGIYPGPTLSVKRGDRIKVKLVNLLEPYEDPAIPRREGQDHLNASNMWFQDVGQIMSGSQTLMHGHVNNFHVVNTTNFHTHGFHVSPLVPQDNVIDIQVGPQDSFQYDYALSPYHSGGVTWYHPHAHGATANQQGQGMVGAIIIEDSPGELPDYIEQMRDELLIIHAAKWGYFGPDYEKFAPNDVAHGCHPFGSSYTLTCLVEGRISLTANYSGDSMFKIGYLPGFGFGDGEATPIRSFLTVNGQFSPTLDLQAGSWIRLRIAFAAGHDAIQLIIASDDCELQLLGKDNTLLPKYPRRIKKGIFLGPGNRAQVLLRCSKPGWKQVLQNFTGKMAPQVENGTALTQVVLYLNVEGVETQNLPEPDVVQAAYPRYLQSLVDLDSSEISMPVTENQARPSQPIVKLMAPDNMTVLQDQAITEPLGEPLNLRDYPLRFVINNETLNLTNDYKYQAVMQVGKVYQIQAEGLDQHAWHMHTDPVQYMHFAKQDYQDFWGGYFEVGDWQDVLLLPGASADDNVATVRFQTDCYSGQRIIHCHVLVHEDLGMMTMFNVTGIDHTIDPRFDNDGVFRNAPGQCTKEGSQCAPPYCTDYSY